MKMSLATLCVVFGITFGWPLLVYAGVLIFILCAADSVNNWKGR